MRGLLLVSLVAPTCLLPLRGFSQPSNPPPTQSVAAPIPDHVDIYFAYGSDQITTQQEATLDRIAELYSKARPSLMILASSTDPTGNTAQNLMLSLRRAPAVLQPLVARGLPEGSFELDAKGQNDPTVPVRSNKPQPRDA